MTKVMLVEDDKSLREIYGVRLLAEGYDIVSAGDGEQALAMAIKERPDLIISDIMMPKISGFDLLDILRSTTETRNIKVIMMTALSSEEQRLRGEQLGADRYLVKSQVGIEDVVRVVHEVLGDGPQAAAEQPQPQQAAMPQPTPVQAQPQPQQQPTPASPDPRPMPPPTIPPSPIQTPVQPNATGSTVPKPAQIKSRVIQPINDPNDSKVDIKELLDKELAREAGLADNARPEVSTTAIEQAEVKQQIADFTPPSLEEEEKALDQILQHSDDSSRQDQSTNESPSMTQPTPQVAQPAPQPAQPPQHPQPQDQTTQQPATPPPVTPSQSLSPSSAPEPTPEPPASLPQPIHIEVPASPSQQQ